MFLRSFKLVALPMTLVAVGIACPQANAQQSEAHSATARSSAAQASNTDQQFVMNAAAGGLAEVKLGQLAEERASSQQVKTFGHRMVSDHSAANEKLQAAAAKDGINLPTDLNAADRQTYDKLSKLSGAEFDKAYMADMVKDHKHDISEFEHEARTGRDLSIKQFAQETLPTLREHLKMAETTERSISSSASGM